MSAAPSIPKQAKRWVLASYAEGPIRADKNFRLETVDLPTPEQLAQDEILIKVEVVAFEPAMRPAYSLDKSYTDPQPLDQTLWAFGIGEVIASKSSTYPVGALVWGRLGQAEYLRAKASEVQRYDPKLGVQTLSVLGPPGLAAWVGTYDVAKLKAGQVVLVSGAAGATGSLVVQMAKITGAKKIIGICSKGKMQSVLDAGADAVVDYRSETFAEDLRKATEEKVDVYFENVGGHVLDEALMCMAPFGVVAVCGMISGYEQRGDKGRAGENYKNLGAILFSRLRVEGFICNQRGPDVIPQAIKELSQWAAQGKLKTKLHWHPQPGLENAPAAFAGLFTGQNDGKMLLKVQDGRVTSQLAAKQ